MGEEVFVEGVFLVPSLSEPEVEFVGVVEGHIGYGETAPVHVYGRGWAALEVHASEGIEILAILSSPVLKLVRFVRSNGVAYGTPP